MTWMLLKLLYAFHVTVRTKKELAEEWIIQGFRDDALHTNATARVHAFVDTRSGPHVASFDQVR